MGFLSKRRARKRHEAEVDEEQLARLEKAERDVESLRHRATVATRSLDGRHQRNHWRESIEQMIQGAL